jgi:hypothetical protein
MPQPHTRQIYVALLEGGADAWHCVDALAIGEDTYRILSENPDPDEPWEYTTGETVRCRSTVFPGGERVLVATQRVAE